MVKNNYICRGVPQIEVTFEVDANGILHVKAEDKTAKKSQSITIANDKGRLSQEEIERIVKEAEEFAEEDKKVREKVDARIKLEEFIYNKWNIINDKDNLANKIDSNDKEKVDNAFKEALKWLVDNQNADKEDFDEKLEEVGVIIKQVYEKERERVDAMNKLEVFIYSVGSNINAKDNLADKIDSDDKEKGEIALNEALKWLDNNRNAKKEDFNEKLKEVGAFWSLVKQVYEKEREKVDARNKLEAFIYNIRSIINDIDNLDKIDSDNKEKVDTAFKEALEWLDENQNAEKEDFDDKLKEVGAVWNPVKGVYEKERAKVEARSMLEAFINNIRSTMDLLADEIDSDTKKMVNTALKAAIEWLDEDRNAEVEDVYEKVKKVGAEWNAVIEQIHGKPAGFWRAIENVDSPNDDL